MGDVVCVASDRGAEKGQEPHLGLLHGSSQCWSSGSDRVEAGPAQVTPEIRTLSQGSHGWGWKNSFELWKLQNHRLPVLGQDLTNVG